MDPNLIEKAITKRTKVILPVHMLGYSCQMDKINKIAIDTSSELIQKLIGAEVNNSSISAIVDDLSKRNGNKYYDN